MYTTNRTIARAMGQGLEDKREVVGQGLFASSKACRLLMLKCSLRPQKPSGRGALDVHLDFHTAAKLCRYASSSMLLYVHRQRRTSRDRDTRTSTSNFAQLLSSEACRLSSGAQMCEGTVAGHSNADVMMPVAWPAAVACGLCLCRP